MTPATIDNKSKTLCGNSELSEKIAFSFLGFRNENVLASETILSHIYRGKRVPDSIFETVKGNVAVEVKRVKNVMHMDTVINALEKMHAEIVQDFKIRHYHIVFQTRGTGMRDSVTKVTRDAHGILKKLVPSIPYKTKNGVLVFAHVQKVGERPFKNIGF